MLLKTFCVKWGYDMLEDKEFTTFEQQIKILKNRKLTFCNVEMANHLLRRFGYYNIINGYKEPFIDIIDGEEVYKKGVSFEQIFSLYCMDRKLRTHVMASMLEVEDTLRTAVAHTIGEAFTAEEAKYLKKENYRSGKKRIGNILPKCIDEKINNLV